MSFSSNIISTFAPSNMSAFGTLETGELTPIIQGDFVYGLNTQIWNTATTSGAGATVDTSNGRLRIQSGTSSSGNAYITSRKILRYRAGQGNVVRFTPLFTAGVANNIQAWGIGTIASNALYDGYFFGYNGTAFGIAHAISGSITWTAQTSWNGDKIDGTAGTSFTWDPTKGTPVMIKYPYLGYGDIEFFVQNPTTGSWILVHTIRYANTTANTQLSNPSLQFIGYTLNSGNTSNITMYTGSVRCFVSGQRNYSSNPKWGASNRKATITTQTSVLSLKNATTYNGITNRGLIRLNYLSFAWDGANDTGLLNVILNTTLGGSPSYTTINGTTADSGVTITSGNSIASVDTAGTTITGGTVVFNVALARNSNCFMDLTSQDIYVEPGSTITFAVTGDASGTARVSVNWSEDV